MVSMAEPKTLATRGVLAVLIALGLSAVLFVYTGSIPLLSEMEARSGYLAGEQAPAKAIETTTTVTLTAHFGEGLSVTTETVYTAPPERMVDVTPDALTVTTVTETVTMNVTVTVTKTSP